MIAMSLMGANVPIGQDHVWSKWVDCIVHKKELGFTKAAMVHRGSGSVAAHSKGFQLSNKEISALEQIFAEDINNNYPSKVVYQGHSYITKHAENDCYVAFNGSKHLIVCRSKRFFVVAFCSSRKKSKEAQEWIKCLHKKLLQANY